MKLNPFTAIRFYIPYGYFSANRNHMTTRYRAALQCMPASQPHPCHFHAEYMWPRSIGVHWRPNTRYAVNGEYR